MGKQKILLKKILGEVVEFLVGGAEAIGGGDAGDAGEFVHVLCRTKVKKERRERGLSAGKKRDREEEGGGRGRRKGG